MSLLVFFAFLSGLITIFAPCIWPILPIVLSAGITGEKRKPLGLVTGLSVSFIFFTLTLSSLVRIFTFDPEVLRYGAVLVIGFLGLVLLIPWFGTRLEGLVSRFGSLGSRLTRREGDGFGAGLITGTALGLVWTPCAGPILAAVATLAATQTVGFDGFVLITAYVVGVSIPLYFLTLAGGKWLSGTRKWSRYTSIIQQVFGGVMILSALAIFTGYDKKLQASVLEAFPHYGDFLYVFEHQAEEGGQLEQVRNASEQSTKGIADTSSFLGGLTEKKLDNHGLAPEITGITGWLNSDGESLRDLKGRVVLIDFWTYSCINCIRTLPYVTSWYDKYKDDGLVVIGVHTPEFAFEHKMENVAEAIKRYNIHYPVAQDNNYATWRAYNNHYWPAHYLIDREGNVREVHFGEGGYEETEQAIRTLLKERGADVESKDITEESQQDVSSTSTPETYLGSARGSGLASPERVRGEWQSFTFPPNLRSGEYAFKGSARVLGEKVLMKQGTELKLSFQGEKVFLVMSPEGALSRTASIFLDEKPLNDEVSGKDVHNGQVTVDQDRLYELIDFHGSHREGVIRIRFEGGESSVFAFNFA